MGGKYDADGSLLDPRAAIGIQLGEMKLCTSSIYAQQYLRLRQLAWLEMMTCFGVQNFLLYLSED
jgi:hypothetical protein